MGVRGDFNAKCVTGDDTAIFLIYVSGNKPKFNTFFRCTVFVMQNVRHSQGYLEMATLPRLRNKKFLC